MNTFTTIQLRKIIAKTLKGPRRHKVGLEDLRSHHAWITFIAVAGTVRSYELDLWTYYESKVCHRRRWWRRTRRRRRRRILFVRVIDKRNIRYPITECIFDRRMVLLSLLQCRRGRRRTTPPNVPALPFRPS